MEGFASEGRTMTLVELLNPGTSETRLHFLDEGVTVTLGELWSAGESILGWNRSHDSEPVGMVLTNSSACATSLIGAIVAGATVVSVPPPPRGADLVWYVDFVRRACLQSGAGTLVVDDQYLPLLPPIDGISYSTFAELLSWKRSGISQPENFTLVQFTSGSTAVPKGIVLNQENIAANVSSILDWLQPEPGDGACSWLPFSHDMGLIGMFLSALAGAGPNWGNGIDIAILTPEGFLRQPHAWLEAITQFNSTITSAPNFGFEMAMKRRVKSGITLSSLRACITGAEPVRAETLHRFANTFEGDGFSSIAFCPAYGLAECTLAVAAVSPNEHWHAIGLDPDRIADQEIGVVPNGLQLVSSGRALEGFEIKIDANAGIGEVHLKGNSIAEKYADCSQAKDPDGWFRTNDLGFLIDDELYIIGRLDDVFQVAGRNIYALDVEACVGELSGVRSGRVVAINDNHTDIIVVAESDQSQVPSEDEVKYLVEVIRKRVLSRIGVAPRSVGIVSRGRLPMTSSGKTQRAAVRRALDSDSLPLVPGSIGMR